MRQAIAVLRLDALLALHHRRLYLDVSPIGGQQAAHKINRGANPFDDVLPGGTQSLQVFCQKVPHGHHGCPASQRVHAMD